MLSLHLPNSIRAHLADAEDIAHKAVLLAKLLDGRPAGSLSTTTLCSWKTTEMQMAT